MKTGSCTKLTRLALSREHQSNPTQGADLVKLNLKLASAFLLAALFAAPAFAQGDGPDTFTSKCAPCHGADGLAATQIGKALKAASFKTPAIVKASDAELIGFVKSGKGKMPPWAGKLSDAQIKAVVAYIRTLQK